MTNPAQQSPVTSQAAPLPLDGEGFFSAEALWTRESARVLAALHGVGELGPTHWLVIDFIRAYHAKFGVAPLLRRVCRTQRLAPAEVKSLFGDCLTAWKIAGLPNPGEEAKAYMT